MKKDNLTLLLLIVLASLAGVAMVVYATGFGPGVGGDATIYLTSAQNLLAGKGLGWIEADGSFRLLPYTPPFYPIVLSAVGLAYSDMVAGARWLNVLLLGLTIVMVGLFFYRFTGRAWLAGILGGLVAASPVILGIQVWAMSESLFLLLGFAGLLVLLEYLARPRRMVLIASAVLCGLAFLTRYMGVAFVATGGLALLLLDQGQGCRVGIKLGRKEMREALQFGLIAILPIIAWLVIDFSLTGTVGSRSGQPASAYWQRFLEIGPALQKIVLFWLLPDSIIARLPGIVQAAVWLIPLAGLVGLAVFLAGRAGDTFTATGAGHEPIPSTGAAARLAQLFALFIIVYLVVLAVVQVFTYPPITLASRMLSPVHLAVLVLLFALLHLLMAALKNRAAWRLATGLTYLTCLALLGSYALRSAMIARDYHRTGIGYTAPAWQNSRSIAALRELPENTPIISNETTAIMFLAGRPAYPLQEIYQQHPAEEFTAYGQGEDASQHVFREQGGALVLFYATLEEDFAMYGDRAGERIQALTRGLYLYAGENDGAIYFARPVTPARK
jgi:hypothetical protein